MSSDPKSQLKNALNRIIGPLARLCIRQGVSNSEIEEMIRLAFVEAAVSSKGDSEKELSNNRIGVLTGLNRKEVSRLKAVLAEKGPGLVKMPLSRAQIIVNAWLNDDEFRDSRKKPRILPIRNKKDDVEYASFVALVNRHGRDFSYSAILQELTINKVVEYVDNDNVMLINHAYIPHANDMERIEFIAKSVADLFNTGLYNLDEDDINVSRYQRQVTYSQIDERFVDELRKYIKLSAQELNDEFAVELNKKKRQSKRTSKGKTKTIGFGLYYIEKDLDSDEDK